MHLKQGSTTVDEYDTKFIRLSQYSPHLIPDEGEKIKRFILGLRCPMCQLVGTQIETFLSYSAMVNNARMMEMGKKDDNEFKRKPKRGYEGRSFYHGGTLRAFKPPSRGQMTSMAPLASFQSLAHVSHQKYGP